MKRIATQDELHVLCHDDEAMYVGSSKRGDDAPRGPLENRKGDHEGEGFSGTLYYTDTQNICAAEDELLGLRSRLYPYNELEKSGQPEVRGYVYLISGRKYKQ